jgi:ubiquinol-cytochrome c reductase iron-sulfur subunit
MFDLSGRVFIGPPASKNLAVPIFSFRGDGTRVIGVDAAAETA